MTVGQPLNHLNHIPILNEKGGFPQGEVMDKRRGKIRLLVYKVKIICRHCFCLVFIQLILALLLLCSFIPPTSLVLVAEVFRICSNRADALLLQMYSACW